MLSVRVHEHGDASVIRLDEVPTPAPGPGAVLVAVVATSFNPTEVALRSGALRELFPVPLPFTLGWDVSGVVAALGDGVAEFSVGDRVAGWVDGGAAAEFVVAPVDRLVRVPDEVELVVAAGVPLAGLTAWQVVEAAGIVAGQRVLVNGAGGGIGGFVVQLAKRAGAYVIATASARSAEAVRRLGADEVVDYTVAAVAVPVDVVLNLMPVSAAEGVRLAGLGQRLVSAATVVDAPNARHVVARPDRGQLAELLRVVSVEVGAVRGLADMAEVHRLSAAGLVRGKVLLTTGRPG
ncbi:MULTISPECIES: NADP-dependent oxidoreductase [unclassified Crossiella]|uniref:NADP-dependent oxidoreductase n=1 Tax=unclassified Crossiella TaxID=2620835 RepID=UPI001FFE5A86|nr:MULTISPECIES: NADP-dependent oxidoreductase [unclassified Crossiella]MCK2251592.1 NADP-dependent oxidoreductase [Crossiella sp. S99.1]